MSLKVFTSNVWYRAFMINILTLLKSKIKVSSIQMDNIFQLNCHVLVAMLLATDNSCLGNM